VWQQTRGPHLQFVEHLIPEHGRITRLQVEHGDNGIGRVAEWDRQGRTGVVEAGR